MKPNWTLRQIVALFRGLALMVALFWALVLVQLLPALFRRGVPGVREHITQVAIAGVPPEQWDTAVTRLYLALGATLILGVALFLGQKYLGRKLTSSNTPGSA